MKNWILLCDHLGGDDILLIKDGKFVLSGTETLNEPLTEIG